MMDEQNFGYTIFQGNATRQLPTQIQSTLKVPDGLLRAKGGVLKADTGKKPLSEIGNTLVNVRRMFKSMPEACSSVSDMKGAPDVQNQCNEVFCDELEDSWDLDPVPQPKEDNYEDILPSNRDLSVTAVHKMMYLWEQYDIPQLSSWGCSQVKDSAPLSDIPLPDQVLAHMEELPVPDAVHLAPLTSF